MNVTQPALSSPRPKVRRVRVYPRLRVDHHKRLAAHCAAMGMTLRQGIDEAVDRYLDGNAEDGRHVFAQLQKIALTLEAEAKRRDTAHREPIPP